MINQLSALDVFKTTGLSGVQKSNQFGHQPSYWLWTSVFNFSDLPRTGDTLSTPPNKSKSV